MEGERSGGAVGVQAGWRAAFDHVVEVLRERYAWDPDDPDRPLVAFVVGAGASMWSGMPLWGDIKEQILEVAKHAFPSFLEEACIRLETTLGSDGRHWTDTKRQQRLIDRATTDQICGVACQIELVREAVLAELRRLYGGSEGDPELLPPQLAYELLAHFLKHAFADHVVTLNFDDLMSTAMKNELGPDEFDLITSDHAPRPPAGGAPTRPRVIQLHGSVLSEPTLRFTIDTTDLLTRHTKEVLWETLFADGRPLHLISLGYSWKDPDLARWIASLSERIASLTVVRLESTPPPLLESGSWRELFVLGTERLSLGRLPERGAEPPPVEERRPLSIDHFLWAVWNRLRDAPGDGTLPERETPRPQPAARHLVLGTLFGPRLDEHGEALRDDDEALRMVNGHDAAMRFKAEVILHVIKCQGMVTASMMARDFRMRRYRRQLRSQDDFRAAIYGSVGARFLSQGSYPEVKETLFSRARLPGDFAAIFGQQGFRLSQDRRSCDAEDAQTLLPVEAEHGIGFRPVETLGFLEEQVKRIQAHPEVEIVRTPDPRTEWLFEHSRQLFTIRRIEESTRKVLAGSWSDLLLVAETGQWLTRPPHDELLERRDKGRVLLLSAHLPSQEEWGRKGEIDERLEEHFGRLARLGVDVREASMPWWQHNRHLTLAIDGGRLVRAVFFQRPNKASRVAPVYTSHGPDCVEVFVTFLTYVRRTLERKVFEDRVHADRSKTSEIDGAFCSATLEVARQVGEIHRGDDRIGRLREVIARLSELLALPAGPEA